MGRVFHLLLLIVIIVFSQIASGQDYGTQAPVEYSDRPAQYILGSDVLLITVNLWGHVQKPGIYSIPSAFGIVDLLGEGFAVAAIPHAGHQLLLEGLQPALTFPGRHRPT